MKPHSQVVKPLHYFNLYYQTMPSTSTRHHGAPSNTSKPYLAKVTNEKTVHCEPLETNNKMPQARPADRNLLHRKDDEDYERCSNSGLLTT